MSNFQDALRIALGGVDHVVTCPTEENLRVAIFLKQVFPDLEISVWNKLPLEDEIAFEGKKMLFLGMSSLLSKCGVHREGWSWTHPLLAKKR